MTSMSLRVGRAGMASWVLVTASSQGVSRAHAARNVFVPDRAARLRPIACSNGLE